MSDEGRYNMLPAIAAGLGLETSANAALWRDAAILALNQVHIKASSGICRPCYQGIPCLAKIGLLTRSPWTSTRSLVYRQPIWLPLLDFILVIFRSHQLKDNAANSKLLCSGGVAQLPAGAI